MQKTFCERPQTDANSIDAPDEINPAVLAELPPAMVEQVIRDYKRVLQSKNGTGDKNRKKEAKPARIDHFFSRK
jgi:hypothetical protein